MKFKNGFILMHASEEKERKEINTIDFLLSHFKSFLTKKMQGFVVVVAPVPMSCLVQRS